MKSFGFMRFLFGNKNQREKAALKAAERNQIMVSLREKLRKKQELTEEEKEELNKLAEFKVYQFWGSASRFSGSTPSASRSSRRYHARMKAFSELTKKFPGTARSIRRSMANDLSKRQLRAAKRTA